MRLRPIVKLRDSARLLRRQPLVSLALGAGLVLALVGVCCGFGALAAAWFGCELFAFQIAVLGGTRPARTRAWLGAGLFLLGAVVVGAAAVGLAALGFGADVPVASMPDAAGGTGFRAGAVAVAGGVLALGFIVPFLYAPLILVDRGGTLGGAALESARLVVRDGVLSHVALSLVSHVVQLAPVLIAVGWAVLLGARSMAPFATLVALPLLAVTVPLGQGAIVGAWIDRRGQLVEPTRTRPVGRPSRAITVALAALTAAPALALGLGLTALARPSRPQPGEAPPGEVLIDRRFPGGEAATISIRGTALDVQVEDGWLSILAWDGGGSGRFPEPTAAPLERLRVVRVGEAFALEASAGGQRWLSWVDRAGVRLDDDLRDRLADRFPPWALGLLALALALSPFLLGRALVALAEARRVSAHPDAERPSDADLVKRRRDAHRRAWVSAAMLAPVTAAALAVSALAALG